MTDRDSLLPRERGEGLRFLLDVLAGRSLPSAVPATDELLAVIHEKLRPFVYWRLREAGLLDAVPAELAEACTRSFQQNRMLHLKRVADLRAVTEALAGAGIPCAVLKGPVLAALVYPHPASRTMLDVDILVPEDRLDAAVAVMCDAGWVIPEEFVGRTMEAGDAPPLIQPRGGSVVLELHALLDSAPDDASGLRQAWASLREVDLGGLKVRALGREEGFAHVVAHVSRHHRFQGELRSLLDVALLLRSEEGRLDWAALIPEWERRGIGEWVALTIWLTHLLLDAPLPHAFRDRRPDDEALRLAANQLWWEKTRANVPWRIVRMLARTSPAPVHAGAHESRQPVPLPAGASVLGTFTRQALRRVQQVTSAVRRGSVGPIQIAREAELLRGRERLFELLERKR